MNRAERRRATRAARKAPEASITLVNPQKEHFPGFIFGNATMCEQVVEMGSAQGQHLILCGAGPSLAENAEEYCPQGDQVWGVNSALPYLLEHGHNVTHGFTVDQQPEMCQEWASTPDVEYLLASTCHPHLTELLQMRKRQVRFFHNFVGIPHNPVAYAVCGECGDTNEHGIDKCKACGSDKLDHGILPYEDWLYSTLYPATLRAGSGLNSVTRAVDVARYMGFSKISILGADCALRTPGPIPFRITRGSPEHFAWLREHSVMHADGGHALASNASALTLGGVIDGRHWETKPDLIISAVWLVKLQAFLGPEMIDLVGDTLPNALKGKSDEFLSRLPTMVDADGTPIPITLEAAEVIGIQ